ncbi:Protein kinase superfamily protein [Perilla frutescens var. frutescens]|nr:Protein kinase superfamily protein [Perilla frutescens var. frutescens]
MNLITTIIGFGMSATFIVFVCTRLFCGRLRQIEARQMFEIHSRIDLELAGRQSNGLAPVVVAAIPTMKFNREAFSSMEDAQCTICLAEYQDKEILRIMPKCGHSFHLSCIDVWLRKQSTCPVCRLTVQDSIEAEHARSATPSIPQSVDSLDIRLEHSEQWMLPNAASSELILSSQMHRDHILIQHNSNVAREAPLRTRAQNSGDFLEAARKQKNMVAAVVGLLSFSSALFSVSPPLPRLRLSATKPKPFTMASMTMSEDPIREWILSEGKATQITGTRSVGGGCINRAYRYETDAGSFFVKTNRSIGPSMFEGEVLGLSAMYETRTIRVPQPFKFGPLPSGGSFIIMEFIEFGASRGNQAALGRKLAEMHKAGRSTKGFGFDVDNTIGSTPQMNTWTSDWIEFYGVHRLGYQLKLARQQFGDSLIYERGQRLIKNMASLFNGAVLEPCLLHGDLWSGNISYDKNGEPLILDPACYYGHNEAEFGMSWCAGFSGSFYNAYFEVLPKQPGFEERKDLYMLYHYLNHYNLFGSGYRSSAMSIIDDYLRMLGA